MSKLDELNEAIESNDHARVVELCREIEADHGPWVVQVSHDSCAEDPLEHDGWAAYSFSTRHSNYRHPDDFTEDEEFQAKREAGLAFFLSYYEHGLCRWDLAGEGPQCRWDSVSIAGVIVWEQPEENIGAKTYEDRQEDARNAIESFTNWCNGEVYGYEIVNGDYGCWGFYDLEDMFREIANDTGSRPVKFIGDAAGLADYHWPVKEEVPA